MRYLAGFAILWLVIFGWGSATSWQFMIYERGNWLTYTWQMLGVPIGAAWVAAELARLVRGDAAIKRRMGGLFSGSAIGLGAGLVSVGLVLVTWAMAGWNWNDSAVLGGASGAVSLFAFMPRRRRRQGRCVNCGYSLEGLPTGRCPECGVVDVGRPAVVPVSA